MKNIYSFILLISLLLIFLQCGCGTKKSATGIETIDLSDAYRNADEVRISSVADSIEYLLLENSKGHMVDVPEVINVFDSLVLEMHFQHIYLFNKRTGMFLHELSSFGRGPDEHSRVCVYYEKNNTILASDFNSTDDIICYSLDGKDVRRHKQPETRGEDFKSLYWISRYFPICEDIYAGYSLNFAGDNPERLVIFDSTGSVKKRYLNYNRFEKEESTTVYINGNFGVFFPWSDTLRFFELFTDTIFTITAEAMIPRFHLAMGELAPPYYLQSVSPSSEKGGEHQKYLELDKLQESDRFIFFTLRIGYYCHLGYYDKKTKKTFICDSDPVIDKDRYKFSNYPIRNIGFINDIDDFLPVATGKSIFINKDNKLITYILASDVEQWFQMNPDKAAKLPERLKKFSTVRATDNIIVQVVYLKK